MLMIFFNELVIGYNLPFTPDTSLPLFKLFISGVIPLYWHSTVPGKRL